MGAAPRHLVLIALAALLGGCLRQEGDLGRIPDNHFNDSLLPRFGNMMADWREEPYSNFQWTDDERTLRRLGYNLLLPAHSNDQINYALAELHRTRVLPIHKWPADPRGYCKELLKEDYASSHARYHRLLSDIRTDRDRIAPFFTRAALIVERDRVRERALTYVTHTLEKDHEMALGRIAENRMFIDAVKVGLNQRVESYRCGLHRLVIATPEAESVLLEKELAAFEADVAKVATLNGVAPSGRHLITKNEGEGPARPYFPRAKRPEPPDEPVEQK